MGALTAEDEMAAQGNDQALEGMDSQLELELPGDWKIAWQIIHQEGLKMTWEGQQQTFKMQEEVHLNG